MERILVVIEILLSSVRRKGLIVSVFYCEQPSLKLVFEESELTEYLDI